MTYSLAVTGVRSDNVAQTENITLADQAAGGGVTVTIPTPGGMQRAMSLNTPFLGKGPDGAERLYTLDAERSTPTVPILKPVG